MRRDERARRWVLRELERLEQRRIEAPVPDRSSGSADPDARKTSGQREGAGQN